MEEKRNAQLVKSFSSPKLFEEWLAKHHSKPENIWIRIFKKNSTKKGITYDEALDIALCFGWIDSQKKTYDEESWIQKFTPRRAKSIWSKRNKERALHLIKVKRVRPSGLREIENAKKDGRWDAAYEGSRTMKVPEDFLKVLKKNKKAYTFFKNLNKANTYAIAWRLHTAKKLETRERRMKAILAMLAREEVIH
jgi:uncharacterized protein YdeI (YjbR/CyaY-like superfamily)